ncbi:proteasome complex subunit Rpn13 ubiquitin receptor-domain-containing protein [Spinellus fusiger]|nr:proteasome complex subunit Rpn13 ubiquitin receptor-domain-containing protein [Spinellus fusiger]
MSLFLGNESPYLIQFNAGKCVLENTTVSPDVRKGVIYMDQSDDQLMHLYWRERKATQPEEDMILFPDEAELFKVEACTTGRVYVLKFKSSRQRLFFWMQDKDEAEDEARVQRVLQLMNHPQSALQSPSMSFDGSTSELIQMFNDGQDIDITQENLLQFLQSAGGLGSNALLDTSSKGELSLQQLTELRHKMEQAREQGKRAERNRGRDPIPRTKS